MIKRIAVLSSLVLASCVGGRAPPPPAPVPQARPVPVPRPAPLPVTPAPVGWADQPLTPGSWTYEGSGSTSHATFGSPSTPLFRLYCEGPTRSLFLQRYGAASGRIMIVRTSYTARSLVFAPEPSPTLGSATLPARDTFADGMAFSRGRFSVEVAGTPSLVLPAWAEVGRVVEDCRR